MSSRHSTFKGMMMAVAWFLFIALLFAIGILTLLANVA